MDKFIEWSQQDRAELFELTASNRGMPPTVVEKDFWVCWILKKMFEEKSLYNEIMFKGGTTLSKVFGIIERFSEDIDLILDWRDFVPQHPETKLSHTKQNEFNQKTNEAAQNYLKNTFMPKMKDLIGNHCKVVLDDNQLNINVSYPASFNDKYIRPEVLLEFGPLAAWEPNKTYFIKPYVAEDFPDRFDDFKVRVQAIEAKRTFWEKATILHVEAHRPEDKNTPPRYSRHYYDMMSLAKSDVRQAALADLNLLRDVVDFKSKFYYQAWARYDLATPGSFKLYPPKHVRDELIRDYRDMQIMIFGKTPKLEEILTTVKELETEINTLNV